MVRCASSGATSATTARCAGAAGSAIETRGGMFVLTQRAFEIQLVVDMVAAAPIGRHDCDQLPAVRAQLGQEGILRYELAGLRVMLDPEGFLFLALRIQAQVLPHRPFLLVLQP